MQSSEDDEQQLHLRWNNHTNNMMDIFREQFCKQNLVDVSLSCQGNLFRAHRMVLSACSPYFQDIFESHDTPHPIIILNNMNFNHVKSLLEFMYRGEVKVLESELESFLQIAEVLQIKGLCNIRTCQMKRQSALPDKGSEPASKQPKISDEGTSQFSPERDASEGHESNNEESSEESSPSNVVKKSPKVPPVVRVQVGDSSTSEKGDNDLASLIKVEPPDIQDIDGNSLEDADGPRVIIDLPVVTEDLTTITTTTIRASPKNKGRPKKDRDMCDDTAKIRRPPNAFMIFANEWRRKLAVANPSESNKAISIRLGVMWKSMNPTEKEAYYNMSKQADFEHKQKYPGYYYSPKEAREALLRKKLTKKKTHVEFEATQLVRVLMPDDDDHDELEDQGPFS